MATDFNKPVVTDAYATLLPGLVQAHKDLARMLEPTLTGTHTNVPVGTVRWNATTIRWERYNGTAWVTLPAAGNNVYAISISGDAATATALATARTIGGVSFNGTANIDLPGVNTAGNQNTSGNAATATKLATARTIGGVSFDGTANINLPGVNTTGNQNTTGNAATATLATTAGSATAAGTATSLAAGSAGTIPYQSAAGTTAMLAAGTAGHYLKSNAGAAPSWEAIPSLGVGQTWQNMTGVGGRAIGVTMTNFSGNPIMVSASVSIGAGSGTISWVVSGVAVITDDVTSASDTKACLTTIVPYLATYTLVNTAGNAIITTWAELR